MEFLDLTTLPTFWPGQLHTMPKRYVGAGAGRRQLPSPQGRPVARLAYLDKAFCCIGGLSHHGGDIVMAVIEPIGVRWPSSIQGRLGVVGVIDFMWMLRALCYDASGACGDGGPWEQCQRAPRCRS